MKLFTVFVVLVVAFLLVHVDSKAQITITKADLDAGFVGVERTKYGVNDSGMVGGAVVVNLGTPSSSPQTLDFSHISFASTRRETTSTNLYIPNSGMPAYSSFPTATVVALSTQGDTGSTFTIASYLSIQTNGFFVLGIGIHYVAPLDHIDTTFAILARPALLIAPLPLTYPASSTSTDTIDIDGITINTRTFTVDGFGSVTYPDGTTKDALRITIDETSINFDIHGVFNKRERKRSVEFTSKDLWTLKFNVDTLYTGGNDSVKEYSLEMKTGVVSVREVSNVIPEHYQLSQNYPNPFNPTTSIKFDIKRSEFVTLKVYDVIGHEVATLVNQQMTPGSYEAEFDANKLSSGLYFYRLTTGSFVEVKKMSLVK